MGNCFKVSFNKLKNPLNTPLIENNCDNEYDEYETEFNNLYSNIQDLTKKINELDNKINILENNTQQNIKLLSEDIHHINNTTPDINHSIE